MDTKPNIKRTPDKKPKPTKNFNLRNLRISLKYRPKIFRLILKLRLTIHRKNKLITKFKQQLKTKEKPTVTYNASSQTEDSKIKSLKEHKVKDEKVEIEQPTAWNIDTENGENEKSIAEQVKEVAQSALAQSGMVYVESAGMYYDYKTGYYYNSELGLYYHTDTNCYYFYSDEKQEFVFHSYPDTSKVSRASEALKHHERKKAKKHKQDKEETGDGSSKPKLSKKEKKREKIQIKTKEIGSDSEKRHDNDSKKESETKDSKDNDVKKNVGDKEDIKAEVSAELEDGECSDTASEAEASEKDEEEKDSYSSTATESDDESVAKHHPPCMRVIVRETKLPKLKVGSLFLITKDGGTIGREGELHTILLQEHNVSRNHLDVRYDLERRVYVATDLGSKNGTILNGNRMSESQVMSLPLEVPHGSTIQLGVTKLLCHIHPGTDTCGHCEPGLIMAAEDKEKRNAYTRTCSVQKQHALELARLKNKYAPEPLAIEEGTYNDRAKARRETVGSSHGSEKTQQSDLDTAIAPENKGFKLLEKMGWSKGEGLGKDRQGDIDPIPLVNNERKVGLGAAGAAAPVTVGSVGSVPLKMRARSKALRPPARLFRDPLEEDDE